MKPDEPVRVENKLGYSWVFMPDAISRDDYREIETYIGGFVTAEKNRLVLDLAETNNIYSSGLGLLIRLNKMVTEKNGAMYIVNVSPALRELFSMVNLDKYFTIYESDVEFQVFQEDAWNLTHFKKPIPFLCMHQIEKGVCRVHLSGKMTSGNDMGSLNESIHAAAVVFYLFDMIGLDIIDMAGAGLLFRVVAHITSRGGRCLAFGANDIVKDLLHAFHEGPEFPVFDSEDDALKSIGK
jgi:anti-anti-sigma factor